MICRQQRNLIVFAAAGLLAAGCFPEKKWLPFESKDGNFKVEFPAKHKSTTSADGKEHRFTTEYRGGRRVLRVGYELDADVGVSIANRFKEVERLPKVRGPVKVTTIKFGKHPAMEATYQMGEGPRAIMFRHRIYHVGTTSYQVIAAMQTGENGQKDAERFLASFQLLRK